MNPLFHSMALSRRTISWSLVVCLLLLTLVPFHYHLHHPDQSPNQSVNGVSAAHDHVADIHILASSDGSGHHEGSHTLEPMPDIRLKNYSAQLPVFALLLSLFILLPPAGQGFRFTRLTLSPRLPRHNRHTTPPLRAPPRD